MNSVATSNELLQTVSRSFALCIPLLEKNKMVEVENMYLLSRIVDTIEDSSLGVDRKKVLMVDFFKTLNNEENIDDLVHELHGGVIDEHDKVLAIRENYMLVLDVFHSIDKQVQDVSIEMLGKMSSGMVKYLEKEVEEFEDLDEYCYYVAGTVGLYMNRLVELKDGVHLSDEQAISLGLYLQKVNIIKNFHKDQREGRNFWPTSLFNGLERKAICNGEHQKEAIIILKKMITNAMTEAETAFEYASSIPYSLNGYRVFVLLSAFMATENLRLMYNNPEIFTNPGGVKIPRSRMPEIIDMAEKAACSNRALQRFRKELKPAL